MEQIRLLKTLRIEYLIEDNDMDIVEYNIDKKTIEKVDDFDKSGQKVEIAVLSNPIHYSIILPILP